MGEPSLNARLGRSLNVYVVPSGLVVWDSASSSATGDVGSSVSLVSPAWISGTNGGEPMPAPVSHASIAGSGTAQRSTSTERMRFEVRAAAGVDMGSTVTLWGGSAGVHAAVKVQSRAISAGMVVSLAFITGLAG